MAISYWLLGKPIASAAGGQIANSVRRRRTNSSRAKRGYSLLLAVLITSTVLTAASALASIVVSEIRQTRELTSAMIAQAQAETATEEALFLLRKSDQALDEIQPELPTTLTVAPYAEAQFFSVAENDFVALPIPSGATLVGTPQITTWEVSPTCVASWIEATAVSVEASATPPFQVNRSVFPRGPTPVSLPIFPAGTPTEMRLRALYCDINSLGIVGIPGRIRIVSTGQAGGVQQTIETLASRSIPVGGPFDFVLFSECEIVKGLSDTPLCPQ